MPTVHVVKLDTHDVQFSGPLVCSYVIQNLTWEFGFWFISIALGLNVVMVFFFVPEVRFLLRLRCTTSHRQIGRLHSSVKKRRTISKMATEEAWRSLSPNQRLPASCTMHQPLVATSLSSSYGTEASRTSLCGGFFSNLSLSSCLLW